MTTNDHLKDNVFDDHPSLTASLEDFEDHSSRRSPLFDLPSQHSGFRSDPSDDVDLEQDTSSSAGEPWSPPGFKRRYILQHQDFPPTTGSAWYRHQPYLHDRPDLRPTAHSSPCRSREVSPQYEDALERPDDTGDVTVPGNGLLRSSTNSPLKGRSVSPEVRTKGGDDNSGSGGFGHTSTENNPASLTNYIRFAIRAEVQHREPFVAFFNYIGLKLSLLTKSRATITVSVFVGLISIIVLRSLFLPPLPLPVPDLVKLSGLARSFEPLIYYSENGVQQIGTLQETGVAVWDLGESVRGTNMTSAPIIVRELDELSESLKALSLELTRFFANVDADIDSILIVMDWAKRELEALSSQPATSFPLVVYDNIHSFLEHISGPENGDPNNSQLSVSTRLGTLLTSVFGTTRSQRTHQTLSRTFYEFLSVLEESINNELTHSMALFALFESIDRQFLNLQRTVARESDAQDQAEEEMLSSLWARVLGPDAAAVRKYEKNRKLLASLKERTLANKHLLMDHRGKLLTLKVNLEALRRKLVSPLVRRNDSVNFGLFGGGGSKGRGAIGEGSGSGSAVELVVEGQIRGLEGAYEYLRGVREKQKAKLMEMVYGAGSRRSAASLMDGIANGEGDNPVSDSG